MPDLDTLVPLIVFALVLGVLAVRRLRPGRRPLVNDAHKSRQLPQRCEERGWSYEPDPDPIRHGVDRITGVADLTSTGSVLGAVIESGLDMARRHARVRGRHLVRMAGDDWSLEAMDVSWLRVTRDSDGRQQRRRRVYRRMTMITLPEPVPHLELRRTEPLRRLARRFGLGTGTGDESFDRRFVVESVGDRSVLGDQVRNVLVDSPFETLTVTEHDPRMLIAAAEGRWTVDDHDLLHDTAAELVSALRVAMHGRGGDTTDGSSTTG